ncbi:MAG: hypothetical protein EAZ55_08840 [Cytophagales bacterium]|nr:MAG: hypothetical protein EAZ55_08840 [Cytophagales bacterium]
MAKDKKIDKADFEQAKYLKIIQQFATKKKQGFTLQEVVISTGIATIWVEPTLRALMSLYVCKVYFNNKHELVYHFDFNQPIQEHTLKKYLDQTKKILINGIYYPLLMAWKLIGLIIFLLFLLGFILLSLYSFPFYIFIYLITALFGKSDFLEKALDTTSNRAADFIEYIFGADYFDTPPIFQFSIKPMDKLAYEKILLELITANKGSITIADIIKRTGWAKEKAETEATQLIANYDGEIVLDANAENIIYYFPQLHEQQTKAIEIEDIPTVWEEKYPPAFFNFKLYQNTIKGFWASLWAIGLPLIFVWYIFFYTWWRNKRIAHSDVEFMFWITIMLGFPFFPYLFVFLILLIKRTIVFFQNIFINIKNQYLSELEAIFKILGQTEKIDASKIYLSETTQKKLQVETQTEPNGKTFYQIPWLSTALAYQNPNLQPKQWKILIEDDFKDNQNNWKETDTEQVQMNIFYGYFIKHKKTKGGWTSYVPIEIDFSKDFSIESRISFLAGVDNYGFGIIWGRKDSDNEFEFSIDAIGSYKITKWEHGNTVKIVQWTPSPHIHQYYSTNYLKIKKVNKEIKFYANGKLLTIIDYEPCFGNLFGFLVNETMEIKIEYFKIMQTI